MSHGAVPTTSARTGWVCRKAIGTVLASAITIPTGHGAIGKISTWATDTAASAAATTASIRRVASAGMAPNLTDRQGGRADRITEGGRAEHCRGGDDPDLDHTFPGGEVGDVRAVGGAGEDADQAQQPEHGGAGSIAGGGEHGETLHDHERERGADRGPAHERMAEAVARDEQAEDVEGDDEGEETSE